MIQWAGEDKHIIEEVSSMNGLNKNVVEEIFQYQLINLVEKFARDPLAPVTIRIPLIGDIYIKYVDDEELPDGSIKSNFNSFISLTPEVKKILSSIIENHESQTDTILDEIIDSKIKDAVFSTLED